MKTPYIPAFPSEQGHIPDGTWNQTYDPGMSLRDYFAAAALPQLMMADMDAAISRGEDTGMEPADLARGAYQFADAMLAVRDK